MTETTRKTVSFQMEGEGLTRMMRSWLFDEKKDAEHVIRLLVDLMNNIDVSPESPGTFCRGHPSRTGRI